jgi:hypothetical protein
MPNGKTWHVFPSELHTVSVFSGYLNKNRMTCVSLSEWPVFIIYGFGYRVGWLDIFLEKYHNSS